MSGRPRDIRLSRSSLLVLAAVSVLATVVILTSGSGRSPAQLAALAALRHHTVTVAAAPPPASARATGGGGSVAGAPTPASTPAPAAPSGSGAPASPSADTGSSPPTSGASSNPSPANPTQSTPAPRPAMVRHLFVLSLSTPSYDAAFGSDSPAPYLRSLESRGTLLSGMQSLGAGELADNLALVSGQGPNPDTASGCSTYAEFRDGTTAEKNGLVPGDGCVYPETALTIGDQVSASGHVWKAYIEDMGTQACAHPNSNAAGDTAIPGTEPGYDLNHNPFVYFHSLLDLGDCASDDQDLGRLSSALAQKRHAPTFSFIAPGACEDGAAGSDTPTTPAPVTTTSSSSSTTTSSSSSTTTSSSSSTTNSPAGSAPASCPAGNPTGIAGEDAFLKLWVPRILASPAYRARGALIIAFSASDASSGGGPVRTGALVLSHSVHRHKTISRRYDPYSLLRSIEDALGYSPLGHAKSARSFAKSAL